MRVQHKVRPKEDFNAYNREGNSGEEERNGDEREEEKKSDRKGIQSEEGEKQDEKYLLQSLLKHPQFQGLLENGSSLPPHVVHLGLSPVDTLQESPDHGDCVDLVWCHGRRTPLVPPLVAWGHNC